MNIKKRGCNEIELKPKSTQNSDKKILLPSPWYYAVKESMTVCSYHVTYAFQSESTLIWPV